MTLNSFVAFFARLAPRRPQRTPPRRRLRRFLCLEALEDRTLPSTAPVFINTVPDTQVSPNLTSGSQHNTGALPFTLRDAVYGVVTSVTSSQSPASNGVSISIANGAVPGIT